ncbi:MAG: NUDIX hydrolase [Candidatus Magasanikbacteria bacterium]
MEITSNSDWAAFGIVPVIKEGDYFILLIKEGSDPERGIEYKNSYWKLPGGRQKRGEDETETLVREINEELGAKVKVTDWVETIEKSDHDFVCFLTSAVHPKKIKKNEEVEEIKLASLKDIKELIERNKILTSHEKVLKKAFPNLL